MQVNDIWGLAGAMITVTLVTTIVKHPQSVGIIKAAGQTWIGSLRAVQGL